jgi:hypothetical protein
MNTQDKEKNDVKMNLECLRNLPETWHDNSRGYTSCQRENCIYVEEKSKEMSIDLCDEKEICRNYGNCEC